MIDVCAGLGIDALARAQHGQRVTALELDPLRADLLRHNATALGLDIEVICGDGLDAIPASGLDHLICADPDRRASGKRSLVASEWLPNPLTIAEKLAAGAGCLLKLPPGCDWQDLQRQLGPDWRAIVLSLRSECKRDPARAPAIRPAYT